MIVNSLEMLEEGMFALLRTDPNTGVPLDSDGNWIMKDKPKEYLCFDSEDLARSYTVDQLKGDAFLEWSLVNSSGAQVDVIHDKEALLAKAPCPQKRESFLKKLFKRER